ncbi:hypothetical protein FOZ60_001212 [Perkinsus olseni]|uniref:Uncharacterized protein n=1 Tax=Perkinsus olseni TaxID=32597 RepID=A0A7J6P1R2_PEROL|nr:hypothetical protein FOZ60_001212 [Perkinsus olseni]
MGSCCPGDCIVRMCSIVLTDNAQSLLTAQKAAITYQARDILNSNYNRSVCNPKGSPATDSPSPLPRRRSGSIGSGNADNPKGT